MLKFFQRSHLFLVIEFVFLVLFFVLLNAEFYLPTWLFLIIKLVFYVLFIDLLWFVTNKVLNSNFIKGIPIELFIVIVVTLGAVFIFDASSNLLNIRHELFSDEPVKKIW
jgi:predicted membrane protein